MAYIVLSSMIRLGVQIWQQLNPPPPPPPTVAFGKLEAIKFPESATSKKLVYKLETKEGGLPSLLNTSPVYALPPKKASLLALDQAKSLAAKLGFSLEPTQLSADTYRFSQELPALLTLDVNLINETFLLKYQWQNDESILSRKNFGSEEAVRSGALQTLQKANLLRPDFEAGEFQITFLKASANSLIPTYSLSQADFVRVDIFRADTEELPVVTPKYSQANVALIFSGSTDQNKQLVLFEYNYFNVDYNSRATYPLKSLDSAWEELQQGLAYIASFKESDKETVTIRRVEPAFYDSDHYQPYLQPVYVFRGDDDFVAYVPAISSEWLK